MKETHMGYFQIFWNNPDFRVYKIGVNNRRLSLGDRVDELILSKDSRKKEGAWHDS